MGLADWDAELPTSQHHLMARLARTNRVLFVESLGLRRPQLHVRDLRRLRHRARKAFQGIQPQGDVEVLSALVIPFHAVPAVRFVNRALIRRQGGHAIARLGVRRPILWGYSPYAEALLDVVDPKLVVYHCVDDLAAHKGVHAPSFRAAEERFARHADLVLASAPALSARLHEFSDAVLDAPNVADVDFFSTALADGPVDPALAALPQPRVVFTGAIVDTKLDFDLLTALARQRRDWSFALVGPVGAGAPSTDVSALRREPNVHLLGPRPYGRLPEVLRGADAALIPYALNALTMSVFPMKVYEYLAAGLPVVTTRLPALEGVGGLAFAHDARSAARALDRLLSEDRAAVRERQTRAARGHSWDERLGEIAAAIHAVAADAGA